MPISQEDFLRNLASKSNAINEALENKGHSGGKKGVPLPSPREMDTEYDGWSDPTLGVGALTDVPTYTPSKKDMIMSEATAMKSKMPDAIKSSMMSEQIDLSSLERIGADDVESFMTQDRINRIKAISGNGNKDARQTTSPTYSATAPVIDYSLLKDIINGCLDAKLSEYGGTLAGIKLKGGEITIIDHKGNVFTGKLKKIENK